MFHKQVKHTFQRGFTLIELLVVIGILGILAAALVATIDPFEQLRKAQDSNMKNLAVEFLNANIRYYTTHSALPWFSVANGGVNCYTSNTLTKVALSSFTGGTGCLQTLVNEGELKQGFLTASQLTTVYATNPNPQTGNSNDVVVCFQPTSKSQQKDASTIYNQDGSTATAGTCKASGGSTNCYWCAQ
jgi:prepilin-type N-terminal cleavage/methylation domain-containing protein